MVLHIGHSSSGTGKRQISIYGVSSETHPFKTQYQCTTASNLPLNAIRDYHTEGSASLPVVSHKMKKPHIKNNSAKQYALICREI